MGHNLKIDLNRWKEIALFIEHMIPVCRSYRLVSLACLWLHTSAHVSVQFVYGRLYSGRHLTALKGRNPLHRRDVACQDVKHLSKTWLGQERGLEKKSLQLKTINGGPPFTLHLCGGLDVLLLTPELCFRVSGLHMSFVSIQRSDEEKSATSMDPFRAYRHWNMLI